MSSCYTFQFPPNWPSHIYCLSVFPRQIPIPSDWLEQKHLEQAYHPVCNCLSYSGGQFQDPAASAWYLGVCPHRYPYGLYKFAQNILIVDLDDEYLIDWLQDTHSVYKFQIFSYLTDLEYYIYDEFSSLIHYPITMFQFSRYTRVTDQVVELKAKIFGMAQGKVLVTASTSLAEISETFTFNSSTRAEWKAQLFFAVRTALKRDYFQQIHLHSQLPGSDKRTEFI